MKHHLIAALLLLARARAEALDVPMEAGRTNELGPGEFLCAQRVSGTNLYGVTYISQAGPAHDKRTIMAERADVETKEPGLLIIHLRDLELLDERRDGTAQRIKARHYPVQMDIRMMKRIQQEREARSRGRRESDRADQR